MWTRVSSDTSSQLASEGREKCGHEYPPTRAASWLWRAVTNVDTSILRHEEPVGFGVQQQTWTRVSYDTSSQLASDGRDKRGKAYPPTQAASWLRRAVTNVDTSILRLEQPVGFGVQPRMLTRVSYDTKSQLASQCRYKCGHEYPTTRGASWLWRAVTNVARLILRHKQPLGFGGP